jgi:hypothetical protein
MRYWQHGETGRLLKIDVQMSTYTWVEITKEQYEEAILANSDSVPEKDS